MGLTDLVAFLFVLAVLITLDTISDVTRPHPESSWSLAFGFVVTAFMGALLIHRLRYGL